MSHFAPHCGKIEKVWRSAEEITAVTLREAVVIPQYRNISLYSCTVSISVSNANPSKFCFLKLLCVSFCPSLRYRNIDCLSLVEVIHRDFFVLYTLLIPNTSFLEKFISKLDQCIETLESSLLITKLGVTSHIFLFKRRKETQSPKTQDKFIQDIERW